MNGNTLPIKCYNLFCDEYMDNTHYTPLNLPYDVNAGHTNADVVNVTALRRSVSLIATSSAVLLTFLKILSLCIYALLMPLNPLVEYVDIPL